MKVLITNHELAHRSGSELYVRDLMSALARLGLETACYTPRIGPLGEALRRDGAIIIDDLDQMPWTPDIIHAQHNAPSLAAFLKFPHVPAVYVCHGFRPWQEAPQARLPNIRAFIAVDAPCKKFLLRSHDAPQDRTVVIPNGFDEDRFTRQQPALDDPARRQRALLFSNYADPAYADIFKRAAEHAGLHFDAAGRSVDNELEAPETVLPRYGVVFAKARAAIEAMASGCAVILADYGRLGPLVTPENFDWLRRMNFGFRAIDGDVSVPAISGALEEIDWEKSAQVTRRIREEAGFAAAARQILAVYKKALALPPVYGQSQGKAVSAYLGWVGDTINRLERQTAAPPEQDFAPKQTAGFPSRAQELGEAMAEKNGFLGVPSESFDEAGRSQFVTLLNQGLSPESRVMEIGCGVLRAGYWLIRFLDPHNYCGLEPHRGRVEGALETLFDKETLSLKQPRFDWNADFDLSMFPGPFDFFLAGSIWTHADKRSIQVMLKQFRDMSTEDGVFLASYLPARSPAEDYQGTGWVGTSHESDEPGIVRHALDWMLAEAESHGLLAEVLDEPAFDSQFWLKIRRQPASQTVSRETEACRQS